MTRTQVQFTEEQLESLKRQAAQQQISVAELVRRAVDSLLESDVCLGDAEQRQRALGAAGQFASGRSDVSENHDDFLAEAYRS